MKKKFGGTLGTVAVLAVILTLFFAEFGDPAKSGTPAPTASEQPAEAPAVTPDAENPTIPETPVMEDSGAASPVALTVIDNYTKDKSYERSQFGKSWEDVDGNGCDQRNDVLARDLANVTTNSKCQVMTGTLVNDAYTNESIDFVRGEGACDKTGWNGAPVVYNGGSGGCSNAVTIDHVISLEEVWYLGARSWDFDKRVQFANDLDNLYATGANSWKSSKTPSEIVSDPKSPMTPQGLCTYLKTYQAVALKYELPITVATSEALNANLPNC